MVKTELNTEIQLKTKIVYHEAVQHMAGQGLEAGLGHINIARIFSDEADRLLKDYYENHHQHQPQQQEQQAQAGAGEDSFLMEVEDETRKWESEWSIRKR